MRVLSRGGGIVGDSRSFDFFLCHLFLPCGNSSLTGRRPSLVLSGALQCRPDDSFISCISGPSSAAAITAKTSSRVIGMGGSWLNPCTRRQRFSPLRDVGASSSTRGYPVDSRASRSRRMVRSRTSYSMAIASMVRSGGPTSDQSISHCLMS
jgi:hypothetical protein